MKVLLWLFIGFDQHATSEHLLSAVIEQLCKAGHFVHIIQKNTGGNLPSIPESLSKYNITTDVVRYKAANKRNFVARYLAELKYVNDSKKYITSGFDAVFIQSNNVAGFTVRAIQKKLPMAIITFNVQDIFPQNAVFSGSIKSKSLAFRALAAVQKYGYKHSDHIITISEDMKDTLLEEGTEGQKIKVVYNWSYQDELYEDIDITPVSHMFSRNYFNVVYAGNIGVMQNVDILLEAAKQMKEDKSIWFHIIGNGIYKKKLEERAKEYGIVNISFWPMQPPELAPLIYSAADVNVIPLVKYVYRTALPSKTATCLACGKPIIFAIGKDSEFGQLIHKETGCPVIDSDDTKGIVETIKKIKEKQLQIDLGSFFLQYMQKKRNSRLYKSIITAGDNKK